MPVKRIVSRDNPTYRSLLALADNRSARRDSGRTLLDGAHLLLDAVESGIRPVQLIFDETAPEQGIWLERLSDVPAIGLPAALFKKLSPVQTPSGVMAVIDVPRLRRSERNSFVVLLEDIQDPGNLGALLRTSAAAGVDRVYLSRGCADAWSPKALRGGQGGHFRLDIVEGVELVDIADALAIPVHAAALGSGQTLFELDLSGPAAFAFGNEGAGLSAGLLERTQAFAIPMPGGMESLNVAAAAAICLFERVRQCAGRRVVA